MNLGHQQQTVLAVASLCALIFFACLGLIYLLFTLRARGVRRRCGPSLSLQSDAAVSSWPQPGSRVTSPSTFLSYARKASQAPRDKLIQSLQAGLDMDQAAKQLSISAAEAKLIWKSHCASAANANPENVPTPPLAGTT